jgi:hypothetical protein
MTLVSTQDSQATINPPSEEKEKRAHRLKKGSVKWNSHSQNFSP